MGCLCLCALVPRAGKRLSFPICIPEGRLTLNLDITNKNYDFSLFEGRSKANTGTYISRMGETKPSPFLCPQPISFSSLDSLATPPQALTHSHPTPYLDPTVHPFSQPCLPQPKPSLSLSLFLLSLHLLKKLGHLSRRISQTGFC